MAGGASCVLDKLQIINWAIQEFFYATFDRDSRIVKGFHLLFHESVVGPLSVGVRGGTINVERFDLKLFQV